MERNQALEAPLAPSAGSICANADVPLAARALDGGIGTPDIPLSRARGGGSLGIAR